MGKHQTPEQEINPNWSPDGTLIVYAGQPEDHPSDFNWDIYVMKSDGTNRRRLTTDPGADVSPSWSFVRSPSSVVLQSWGAVTKNQPP